MSLLRDNLLDLLCTRGNSNFTYPGSSDIMSVHSFTKNSLLMQSATPPKATTERIEGCGTFCEVPNPSEGCELMKIQSWIFRGNSMLLETQVYTDRGGMVFMWVHCIFEVLNVKEVGEGGFGIIKIKIKILYEKGPAPTLVKTAIKEVILKHLFRCLI